LLALQTAPHERALPADKEWKYKTTKLKPMMERTKAKKAKAKKATASRQSKPVKKAAKKIAAVSKHQSKLAKKHAAKSTAGSSSGMSEQISKWLVAHPLINWQGLCRDAGIPLDVIKLAVHGRTMKGVYKKMAIPDKHCPPLIAVLKNYGYSAKK